MSDIKVDVNNQLIKEIKSNPIYIRLHRLHNQNGLNNDHDRRTSQIELQQHSNEKSNNDNLAAARVDKHERVDYY